MQRILSPKYWGAVTWDLLRTKISLAQLLENYSSLSPTTYFVERIQLCVKKSYDISAFLGVRKLTIIPDIIQLHLNNEIFEVKEAIVTDFRNFLMKKETSAMIDESHKVIEMRAHFLEREEKIQNTLSSINLF